MGDLVYFRGPAPRSMRPAPPPQTAPEPLIQRLPEPTYFKTVIVAGVETRLVVNPNLCETCKRAPHRPTKHHEFTPDRAPEWQAKRLGWPEPPAQEGLL